MADNLLENYPTISVNGSNAITINIPKNGKKFEFWYEIKNWSKNDLNAGKIEFQFEHADEEGLTYINNATVYFPINENTDYDRFSFEIPNMARSVTIYFAGTFTANALQLYVENVSVNTATTSELGVVRTPVTSAISVAEKDDKETGVLAGDIDVKIGDGIRKNDKGELCITSELSASNWESLDRYTNGFVVNGEYKFKRLAGGSLYYVNAQRTITITRNNELLPETSTVSPTDTINNTYDMDSTDNTDSDQEYDPFAP